MRQFLAILYKEALIISRDKAGLGLLFLMPVIFILIMSIAQDSAYKSVTEIGIPVILIDQDRDSLGSYIRQGLDETDFCRLHTHINGHNPSVEEANAAIRQGDFMFGVIIPKGASQAIRESVTRLIDQTLNGGDSSSEEVLKHEIEIIYDPTTQKSFITTISSTLKEFISSMKARIIFQTFTEGIKDFMPEVNSKMNLSGTDVISFKEQYASNSDSHILPNSVQHNVPAWTIFGMFFIVVPLAGSIIKEKQEGPSIRLKTLPGPYVLNHLGKLSVYFSVALLQFLMMMIIAKLLLPLFGLPELQFANQFFSVFIMAIGLSLAATGFGMFVGSICSTYQQAAIGGSLTILILAALGGIWVPMHIMPDFMRVVSKISPLNWGLEAFYAIFLRGQGFLEIWPYVLSLLLFFIASILLTILVVRLKRS